MKKILTICALVTLVCGVELGALTVYPIDRATILAGAYFDFKVELDGVVDPATVSIKINQKDYDKVLGKKADFISSEADVNASAFILRQTAIKTPGAYSVEVAVGGVKKTVSWTITEPAKTAKAKNVIFLLADGLSVGARTAARLLSRGNTEGTANGLLAMDTLDRMGFIGTSSVDSIAVDSANSMSAYMTGQKSSINALGVYADRTKDPFDDPKQETLAEIIKRTTKKSIGIVTDAELEDATPAAVIGHTRLRDEKANIAEQLLAAKPQVVLGGGAAYFIPKSVAGSKRKDDKNIVDGFTGAGYQFVDSATSLKAAMSAKTLPSSLLGLFHPGNMDGHMDRVTLKNLQLNTTKDFPDQPDLTDMASAALSVLSQNKDGFFLMVEAGLVDKFEHPMDWERAVYDTIMFDKVVAIALEFQKTHPDTLVIVTGDHTHSISVYGTVDDSKPGKTMREKVGTYAAAGFPNYVDADKDGYPDNPWVSKRLAIGFGNHPDYWETFTPKLDGTFNPTVKDANGNYVADPQYASGAAVMIAGNLNPKTDATEVHSVDDQIVGATGPGSELVKVYQENTGLFHVVAQALGLKP